MANCLIGLGSNLGDRGENLRAALEHLKQLPETTLLAASSFRDTKPAGGPTAQAPYLNAAARIESALEPLQLLAELQRIENELGRLRDQRWGPRRIDLDLMLYDQVELETPELTLPHPRMSFRRFVLEPAAEIATEMVYSINGWTIRRLLTHQHATPPEICLAPSYSEWCRQAPATRLLQALDSEQYIQQLFRSDVMKSEDFAQLTVERSRKRRAAASRPKKAVYRPNARWTVADFWFSQHHAEMHAASADFEQLLTRQLVEFAIPRLVVIWQPDEAPVMKLLDRLRRNPECPPLLWIPTVSLDQARQEVIAAMAAME